MLLSRVQEKGQVLDCKHDTQMMSHSVCRVTKTRCVRMKISELNKLFKDLFTSPNTRVKSRQTTLSQRLSAVSLI